MIPVQLLSAALCLCAVAAAPQTPYRYNPPPSSYLPPPPPKKYLPPPPAKQYLPPPTTPSPKYLPPPTEPPSEYLPPSNAVDRGQDGGLSTDLGIVGGELSLPVGAPETEGQLGESFVSGDGTASGDTSAGGGPGSAEGQFADGLQQQQQQDGGDSQSGQYDDGQYHPERYASRGPTGDDGRYRPGDQLFEPIADFDFSYAVKDEPSGNDYAVRETNKGGAYRILLPDGRYQIVQYTIDGRGIYRTRITYVRADEVQ